MYGLCFLINSSLAVINYHNNLDTSNILILYFCNTFEQTKLTFSLTLERYFKVNFCNLKIISKLVKFSVYQDKMFYIKTNLKLEVNFVLLEIDIHYRY